MIIRETCKWLHMGKAGWRWYGGRQGWGTVGMEERQICGCGVWRASREKMGGGKQGG